MSHTKSPEFSGQKPKTILFLIVLLSIYLVGIKAASHRRILSCERHSSIAQCRLIDKQLFTGDKIIDLESKLQRAIVDRPKTVNISSSYSRVILVTTTGNFWLTASDNSRSKQKDRIAEKIDTFLGNPQISDLNVDPGYSTIFWIEIIGLFLLPLVPLCVGLMLALMSPYRPTAVELHKPTDVKLDADLDA